MHDHGNISIFFWILMLLLLLGGGYNYRTGFTPVAGVGVVMYLILLLLGWTVFGAPL